MVATNFVVYAGLYLVLFLFNHYVGCYLREDGSLCAPKRSRTVDITCAVGIGLVFVSQFSPLFYYIDAQNIYHRSDTFPLSMVLLLIGMGTETTVMAQGIAGVMGEAYVALSPIVGLLGSFMTSSNMASNILFGSFQLATANFLGLNPAPVLGAQTAGGAIGAAICPGNIVLGCTTAGIMGQEGKVLQKVLPITLAAAAIVGVIMYVACILL